MASWGGDSMRSFQKAWVFGKKPNPEPSTWFLLKDSKQGGQRMGVEHWILRALEDSRINLLSFIREKQLEGKSWRNAEITKESSIGVSAPSLWMQKIVPQSGEDRPGLNLYF